MPLNAPQRSALARAVTWQLGGGLQAVRRELRMWRRRAAAIPDPLLRADALHAIDSKRGHTDGAALFWTLAPARNVGLLRLLVAFEVIYDYLDNVSERGAAAGVEHGEWLFRALADALDPDAPVCDYYRFHPWSDDGGYLAGLVAACRAGCRRLPGFAAVRPVIGVELSRVAVLAKNHELDRHRRESALRQWAADEFGEAGELRWYELTAAASQSVVTFTLLALATNESATSALARATHSAYFPWFAYGVTMLDAFVDQPEDERHGVHSYVAYYPTREHAVRRICESVERAAQNLLALPDGERHAVLLGCMVAMYLSKDSAREPELRSGARRICAAGGTLAQTLMPVLRLWRILNRQRSAT